MASAIQLFDQHNLDCVTLPATEMGRQIQRYWLPLMRQGANHYIQNVQVDLYLLTLGDLVLPVTLSQGQTDNSYVCSPYAHYVTYAKAELCTLHQPFLEGLLVGVLNTLGILLRWGKIDQVVIVNNWLLSTNLYPEIPSEQLVQITAFLTQRFPQFAIVFRSLNSYLGDACLTQFRQAGYSLIASRRVYLFDPQRLAALKTKMRWRLKQDRQLFAQTGYQVVGADSIQSHDVPRLVELYNLLYLEKYCDNNPQFTEALIRQALANGALTLKALRKNGRIDGVIGFYQMAGLMTTPILGYDTHLPRSSGLYRMLTVLLIDLATQQHLILHQSSGAASFKRFRGCTGHTEYSAVFFHHLPGDRQWVWQSLKQLANGLGIPLMKRYQL